MKLLPFTVRERPCSNRFEGIIAINEQGEVTVMNQQAAQILGFTPENAVGKPIVKLLPET